MNHLLKFEAGMFIWLLYRAPAWFASSLKWHAPRRRASSFSMKLMQLEVSWPCMQVDSFAVCLILVAVYTDSFLLNFQSFGLGRNPINDCVVSVNCLACSVLLLHRILEFMCHLMTLFVVFKVIAMTMVPVVTMKYSGLCLS